MDINEIKTWAKNKIESDDLTKQVRNRIKETTWEKQNQREGFRESFKPLISQFDQPEDTKTRNIYTQNQEMLRNQLALTEGLKANHKAITDGLAGNRAVLLALMEQEQQDEDEEEEFGKKPSTSKKGNKLELDPLKNFGENELREIQNLGLMPPYKLLGQGEGDLNGQKLQAEDHLKVAENEHKELYKKKGKSEDEKMYMENLKKKKKCT